MIGSLRGRLEEFEPGETQTVDLVVETGGVGYAVVVGASHAASLSTLGSEVHLSIYTHVREGAITLYGFPSALDRRVFTILLGAHGVGPTLALAILGTYPPTALAEVLAAGDVAALTAVPGVGQKTAQRLLVDLGEKLNGLATSPITAGPTLEVAARAQVREALAGLGYGPDEVREALSSLGEIDDPGDTAAALRACLRVLAPRR